LVDKICAYISRDLDLKNKQVAETVKLLEEGNTVPFIARYRKEQTGGLTDEQLRQLSDLLVLYRNLENTRDNIYKLLSRQGVLTEELEKAVQDASSVTELEDIYRPYRPKRRTRATVARNKGLEPLAASIKQGEDPEEEGTSYVDPEKEVNSLEEALQGARDIIAEELSDDPEIRKKLRSLLWKKAELATEKTREDEEAYLMYHQFQEPVKKLPSHRVLAINRGEKEGCLKVNLQISEEDIHPLLESFYTQEGICQPAALQIRRALKDGWKRLLFPSLERELRQELNEKAEEQAITVFKKNLNRILLTPPVPDKTILGLDPGYRTGCKLACVDATGKLLETSVIYPLPPQNRKEESYKTVKGLLDKHGVDAIAIGNGTGGREAEEFIGDLIQKEEIEDGVQYSVVSEAGASVYSASPLGKEEFSDLDVAERSAVSIARRVLDPLAELVKIDPCSIGVGQYQHDVNQGRLQEALDQVVEDCVNRVGVNVNTASVPLLERVAGINKSLAGNLVEYREVNGPFNFREELWQVSRMGPATFKQCAGFLRIPDGQNYLDRSAVHPESYELAHRFLKYLKITPEELGKTPVPDVDVDKAAETLEAGKYTLSDILEEFKKPGRDPRENMPRPVFRKGVLKIEDLQKGMELEGVVRNVVDFGAFVDLGVHQDGLIHISRLSDEFVRHPLEVVNVGDIVKVSIEELEVERKRISLALLETKSK